MTPASATPGRIADEVLSRNHLGVAHLERYEYCRAVEEFQKALELKPDYLPALVNLGIALYYDSDYSKAAQQFNAALKIDPTAPQAHFMLGLLYTKEYKNQEALKEFEQVLATHPEDSAANYNIGLVFMRERQYDQAIRNFEKVLSLEPQHHSAIYNLGMALMRAGKRDEAQKRLALLGELKGKEQVGGPMGSMGLQYHDEGRFAIAMNPIDYPVESGPEKPGIRFVDVTSSAGIQFVHAGATRGLPLGQEIKASDYTRLWAEQNLVSAFGSGAAFFDYNADGQLDIYLVNCSDGSAGGNNLLYRNNGNGAFSDATREAGVGHSGRGMGVAVGDYNNDGFPDLYLSNYGSNVLYRNDRNGRFTDVTAETGVGGSQSKWSLSAAFFDYDHDGDLDIYVANFVDLGKVPNKPAFRFPDDFTGQPNALFRNNGNGTFTDVAAAAGVTGGNLKSTAVLFMDFNESRDIDIFVQNYGAAGQLFSNRRDGTFADVTAATKLSPVPACLGMSSGDLDKDGFPDLFFPLMEGTSAGRIFSSRMGSGFAGEALVPKDFVSDAKGGHPGWASILFDYDNDGAQDVLAINDRCRLYRNLSQARFVDATSDSGLSSLPLKSPRAAALGDYDADGDVDVLVTENGGRPTLLRNDGGNRNHYLKVSLSAVADNRSAIGAKVEVRSGSLWQKVDITGNAGYLSQGSSDVIIGLGSRQNIDTLRVLWPTGVLQAEIAPASDSTVKVQQIDRKGTSCPLLYAWDGNGFSFVTDFMGGSAFGSLVAPGQYNSTDTDEYVLINASQLRAKDGFYSIRMNNQLEEVMYIDKVTVLAIDHPADVRVFPNERLMPGPPFPEFKLYTTRDSHPPVRAVDDHGHDVLSALRLVDRVYPDGFTWLPFKGFAEKHSLVLDLGDLKQAKKVVLLLTAWIDYANSTSSLAASQAGIHLVAPYLEVVNQRGEWVTALENMGFPAGLPKTMTVDLTGKFLNTTDHRIRITTNMRIYWDRILVDTYAEPATLRSITLGPTNARLGWGGYPKEYSPDGNKPFLYDYSVREQWAPWKSHTGNYTRYGDVTRLLREQDSMYVIMGHGDEIALDFDEHGLPSLAEDWTRSFLVYTAGFGKDMDLNSAYADKVAPLPYHGMLGYPEAGPYPADRDHRQYLKEYNTRSISDTYFGLGFAAGAAVERMRRPRSN